MTWANNSDDGVTGHYDVYDRQVKVDGDSDYVNDVIIKATNDHDNGDETRCPVIGHMALVSISSQSGVI